MTRKELFENERFKDYNCLLIIGSTDIDEVHDEDCVDTAFVVYRDLPIYVQNGIIKPAEFDPKFRKGAEVFSIDIGSPIPNTRNCWSKQEIMGAYRNNSLYCLGTLDETPENTECVVKTEKTLSDFSYEELAKHLCENCNLEFLFNEIKKEKLRDLFNALCKYCFDADCDMFWRESVPKKTARICSEVIDKYLDDIEGQ